MNRLYSFFLALLLLLACTACVGRAAAPDPAPGQAAPLDAVTTQPSEPEEVPEEEPPAPPEPEEPYVRVIDPAKPMVALTFDDGPDETCSNQILDILEEHHALATFFEVGRNVASCPEPVGRMVELGCEVGSHSNAHKDLSKLKKSSLLRDLDTADEAFTLAGAPAPLLVRPPYGAVNKTVKTATGRAMVTWTVDTEDWRSRDAQKVIDYVQNYGALDGEIILMHSIYESTVEAVRVLVPWLQEQGYQLVTVTELMAYYYGELPQPDHFYGYTYFANHGRTDAPIELPSMYLPEEEPEAPPAAGQEQSPDPVPDAPDASDTPDVPPEPFDPTGIIAVSAPDPEPEEAPEPPAGEASDPLPPAEPPSPPQEEPEKPAKQSQDAKPVSPSVSVPNPAMFYP
ncbi:MAG: polysaccharide deacetylase family protein [Oscillospiraceae bacterium]|nr:polysaccharide deacetylase family protein [Oscillospiraceae bacterium]